LIHNIGVAIETRDGNRTELMTAMRIDTTPFSVAPCFVARGERDRDSGGVN
jgi:hypothetical protein